MQQYLAELEQANPVAEPALVSTADPDALLQPSVSGSAWMAYYDNYLIDTSSGGDPGSGNNARAFIRRQQPARRMEGIPGLCPRNLAANRRMEVEGFGLGDGARRGTAHAIFWTDDYSNLLQILKQLKPLTALLSQIPRPPCETRWCRSVHRHPAAIPGPVQEASH